MLNGLRRPELSDYLWLFCLALIWSTSFMFIKIAVWDLPPFWMTSLRLFSAAVALWLIYVIFIFRAGRRGEFHYFCNLWGRVWHLAILSALSGSVIPFSLIAWGETRVDSALAAVLMGVMPLLTLLLAHATMADERLNRFKLLGICFGFSGVLFLTGYDALSGLGEEVFFQLIIVLGAMSYSVNSLLMRHLSVHEKIPMSFLLLFLSALLAVPLSFAKEGFPLASFMEASFWSLFSAILLGVLHTALPVLMMFRILRYGGAGFFSQINYLIPIFGFIWGVLFLSEAFRWHAVIALALTLIGIFVARRGQGDAHAEPPSKSLRH